MKRSRSGTRSQTDAPRGGTLLLVAALAIVLAFAGSFIFGLRGGGAGEPAAPQEITEAEPQQPAVVADRRGRIEVLNGAGKSGLARLATDRLRGAGFDVVLFGNAGELHRESQVLDRIGKPEIANAVGRALGITTVKTAVDTTRYVDATVILGSDWRQDR